MNTYDCPQGHAGFLMVVEEVRCECPDEYQYAAEVEFHNTDEWFSVPIAVPFECLAERMTCLDCRSKSAFLISPYEPEDA